MSERENGLMEISDQEKFLKNYKAVYNAMTAKPDCRSKAYPKNIIVSIEDIIDLNNRIFQKFKTQYEDAGFSMNALISLKDREKIEFPNWKTFEEHNWSETAIITGMVLVWEFNVVLPKYEVPEKHTLTVKISNGIKPEEMFALMVSGKLEQIDEIEQNVCPIVAKMDFVDVTIGNEVLNIVSEWVKGLKNSNYEKGKFMLALQKYRRLFAYCINYLTVFISIVLSAKIIKNVFLGFNIKQLGEMYSKQVIKLFSWILICFIACFIINKISFLISNLMFRLLTNYGDEHVFDITKGDKNQQELYRKKEKNDREKFIISIVSIIFINIMCGVVTYFLTKGK